jgi:AcrR family transcriptional regulator
VAQPSSIPEPSDMRSALLTAAIDLMRDGGAAALTVRNITTRAGCSTTGIYTYFGGKHGLVEVIFVEGFESFDRAVEPFQRADDMAGAARAYRQWALANPIHYMVMFGGAVPDFVPSEDARRRARSSFSALATTVKRIDGPDDHLARAYHLFATIHGYVMLELVGMSAPFGDTTVDDLYEAALRSLGVAP